MTDHRRHLRWAAFSGVQPDVAAAGEALFRARAIGYLATIRAGGAPRIHPVSVTLHDGGLFVSTIAGSHKTADLRRDPRFALHSFPPLPSDSGPSDDEFVVFGTARLVDDPLRTAVLTVHPDTIEPDDPVWELLIERAFHSKTGDSGSVVHRSWPGPRA